MLVDSPYPAIHGHRGCRGLRPENTIPAFCEAIRLGVDVLELDVVLSADGAVVVSHEPWMSALICRTPAGAAILPAEEQQHNLYTMPYAEIRRYDCGLTQHPAFPEQLVQPAYKPLLRDVVLAVDAVARQLGRPLVQFSVEVKSEVAAYGLFQPLPEPFLRVVLAELYALELLPRTTLLCFDKRILQLARQQCPALPLCLLTEDTIPVAIHLRKLGFLPEVYGPDFRLLSPETGAEVRKLGVGLVPWTVNEPADFQRLLVLQPTGITTDYPNRFVRTTAAQIDTDS